MTGPTRRDVLAVNPSELRDSIRISIDRELIDEIDQRRGPITRSDYLDQVLTAALQREHPHLPENWTPEHAAKHRHDRLQRYLDTGH